MSAVTGSHALGSAGFLVRGVLCAVLGMLAVLAGNARAEDAPHGNFGATVDMQWGIKIPMRDGVSLNTTVYKPHGQKDALPVIFTFTPYIGDSYTDRAMYFAGHGYVYALVDVRGRGNSGESSSHS